MGEKRRCTALKADGTRCGAYAVAGKDVCAGHDDESKRKALEAMSERRASLENLPTLVDAESAERFLAVVAKLLVNGAIKVMLARELRLVAKDYASVRQGRLASEEFERLKRRVEELEGQREAWR